MFAPTSSFSEFAAPRHDTGFVAASREEFSLPINNPMILDPRSQSVCNTFVCAIRQGLDGSHSHDMGRVFEQALDFTLTEHSFPKQPFKAHDVMERLVDAGLSMPSRYIPEGLKHYGNDFDATMTAPAPTDNKTSFEASELLMAAMFLNENSKLSQAQPKQNLDSRNREDELRRQRDEMRQKRMQQPHAPRLAAS